MDFHAPRPRDPFVIPGRLLSVDVLRGAAVAAMVFFNNTVSADWVPGILVHARWNGLTLPDGVFPLFLFVSGVAMALAEVGKPPKPLRARVMRVGRRTLVLIALGLLLNLAFYGLPLRYPGILQRIALATLIAAPLVRMRPRFVLLAAFALMVVHSYVLLAVSVPGVPAGTLDRGLNIAGWVDVVVLGRSHLIGAGFDPEGLLGVLTSAAQVLFGVAAGHVLVKRPEEAWRALSVAGVALVLVGLAFSPMLPVNKRLFTATFVLLTAGVNALLLALAHEAVDRAGRVDLARPLLPMGRNAILVYVGAGLVSVALGRLPVPMPGGVIASPADVMAQAFSCVLGRTFGSLAVSAMHVTLWWAVAGLLDRKGIYLKV